MKIEDLCKHLSKYEYVESLTDKHRETIYVFSVPTSATWNSEGWKEILLISVRNVPPQQMTFGPQIRLSPTRRSCKPSGPSWQAKICLW